MKTFTLDKTGLPIEQIPLYQHTDLPLDVTWRRLLSLLCPHPTLRPIQWKALHEVDILHTRRHLLINAPTNSGKTLLGYLLLLEAVRRGKRALFLTPLRALAREKHLELQSYLPQLRDILKLPLQCTLHTGDVRRELEHLGAKPPKQSEIIIATPERIEAISRQAESQPWLEQFGTVLVDEAHLLEDKKRGPLLELLLARLLHLPQTPRLALLSATIQYTQTSQEWLAPCDTLEDTTRTPPLTREIISLSAEDDPFGYVEQWLTHVTQDEQHKALIFVYGRKHAEQLAKKLSQAASFSAWPKSAIAPYHAGISQSQRHQLQAAFTTGEGRCLVTTTALAMGINLPCTHVLLRDTTFFGDGKLTRKEITQILGRAGRGFREGHGTILLRPSDTWRSASLKEALQTGHFAPLRSALQREDEQHRYHRHKHPQQAPEEVARLLTSVLSRYPHDGLTHKTLYQLLSHTLAGKELADKIDEGMLWLTDPMRHLAYKDEHDVFHLTRLGQKATHAVLPLSLAAGVGQLFRDLWSLSWDQVIQQWQPLDQLILLELLTPRPTRLRRFSEGLAKQLDHFFERQSSLRSVLFTRWFQGPKGHLRAEECLGSLGVELHLTQKGPIEENARKIGYMATFHALVLLQRALGVSVKDLQTRWKVSDLPGREEAWRDNHLWLLAGLAKVYDLPCFYFHLKEECDASKTRIQQIKYDLKRLRRQCYDLSECLTYCSPLGPLLRGIRHHTKGKQRTRVGPQTIKRLEQAGFTQLHQLAACTTDELIARGIRKDLAKQITHYLKTLKIKPTHLPTPLV